MLCIFLKYDENPKSVSHSFLDKVLFCACGIKDAQQKLKKSENGKPFIDNAVFSISHSKNALAVAVVCDKSDFDVDFATVIKTDVKSDVSSLGVDIESIGDKDLVRCKKIASAKFFDEENEMLTKSSDKDFVRNFCALWTKKESYSKFTGVGLKDALSFNCAQPCSTAEIYTDFVTVGEDEYALSVCYNSETEK